MGIKENIPLTPQHLVGSKSGISYMMWSMIYIVVGMVYFARPTFLYYYNQFMKREIPVVEISIWFAVFLLVNLMAAVLLYRRSMTLWNRKEW